MIGTTILSHGLESGPEATKVTAMAAAAEQRGWRTIRPDYRDLDAAHGLDAGPQRLARLLDAARSVEGPLVLAGSSFGAFISGMASLQIDAKGLFLLALPLRLRGHDTHFDAANVPLAIVHAWDDELIPARAVVDFAEARRATLHLVADTHRLADHVEDCARWFGQFLDRLVDHGTVR
jgi:alpha/beta superfamily hydrolase